jgi:para-nitrobenzyl esterase
MSKVHPIVSLLFAFLCVAVRGADDGPIHTAPVSTTHGPVVGFTLPFLPPVSPSVQHFFGIPYAKPPVGERRWKAPEKPEAWTAPRECFKFSRFCPQRRVRLYGFLGPSCYVCLYFKVWTGANVTVENKIEP